MHVDRLGAGVRLAHVDLERDRGHDRAGRQGREVVPDHRAAQRAEDGEEPQTALDRGQLVAVEQVGRDPGEQRDAEGADRAEGQDRAGAPHDGTAALVGGSCALLPSWPPANRRTRPSQINEANLESMQFVSWRHSSHLSSAYAAS